MCGGTVRVPLRVERVKRADKPARRREEKGGDKPTFFDRLRASVRRRMPPEGYIVKIPSLAIREDARISRMHTGATYRITTVNRTASRRPRRASSISVFGFST